jgi:site-specific DNA recombinase
MIADGDARGAAVTLRVAFYGRTSSQDAQDPSLSIPRQLAVVERIASALGARVVGAYFDVESGRKSLDERGRGADPGTLGVTAERAGGLHDLLRDAERGAFDVVMVESIDRVSRKTFTSTQIEEQLGRFDIPIVAADEPTGGAASSMLLTRRVKQALAEFYILDLLDKSRRGMEASVEQGWHTGGRPPYGYRLEEHPHPNPSKARDGRRKHRLIIDQVPARAVVQIFDWYCVGHKGLGEIVDRLNCDRDTYPPPVPNRKDASELARTWSRSSVQAILRNPKYTGYNVWNRHDKRRGRQTLRPRDQWVWSSQPTHPALVSRELFEMVDGSARQHEHQAATSTAKPHPGAQTKPGRLYPTAGHVFCAICGCRLQGSYQRHKPWMRCQYLQRRGGAATAISGHPKSLQLQEQPIVDAIVQFLGRTIFNPDRLHTLSSEIAAATATGWQEHAQHIEELRAKLEAVDVAIRRQVIYQERYEPDSPAAVATAARINELTSERAATESQLRQAESERPAGAAPDEIEAVLRSLPDLRATLAHATPEDLAEILDAFHVTAVYDPRDRSLDITATVAPDPWGDTTPETKRPAAKAGRRTPYIAGAGFEPATFGL